MLVNNAGALLTEQADLRGRLRDDVRHDGARALRPHARSPAAAAGRATTDGSSRSPPAGCTPRPLHLDDLQMEREPVPRLGRLRAGEAGAGGPDPRVGPAARGDRRWWRTRCIRDGRTRPGIEASLPRFRRLIGPAPADPGGGRRHHRVARRRAGGGPSPPAGSGSTAGPGPSTSLPGTRVSAEQARALWQACDRMVTGPSRSTVGDCIGSGPRTYAHAGGTIGGMADIAVIGGGIAGPGRGVGALAHGTRVTVYESDAPSRRARDTRSRWTTATGVVPVDTGFIVYNERNYPNLVRLFAHLGVPTEPSDMSFAVSLDGGRFEYQARALGLLAAADEPLAPRATDAWSRDMVRFTREARRPGRVPDHASRGRLPGSGADTPSAFRRDFLLPMRGVHLVLEPRRDARLPGRVDDPVPGQSRPAARRRASPRWRTVTGGSRDVRPSAVRPLRRPTCDSRRPCPAIVRRARRRAWSATRRGGIDRFDHVVLATHADTIAPRSWAPTRRRSETQMLQAFRYQENRAVLHRDLVADAPAPARCGPAGTTCPNGGRLRGRARVGLLLDEPPAEPPDRPAGHRSRSTRRASPGT